MCFETKPGSSGQSVATAEQPIQWSCECLLGKDTCKHVRALAMTVAALPRRADSGLPAPSTVLKNAWKEPGSGVIYEKEAVRRGAAGECESEAGDEAGAGGEEHPECSGALARCGVPDVRSKAGRCAMARLRLR